MPKGTLSLNDGDVLEVINMESAIYALQCPNGTVIPASFLDDFFNEYRAPFYGSVAPIVYTMSGATSLAWLLLLLLIISEKRRPMFQMLATGFVAASLTAILSDVTQTLKEQYANGYLDAYALRMEVFGTTWVKALTLVNGFVLMFAHIQVVLRLFNRSREKLIIEVVGLLLIGLNIIFWCLAVFTQPVEVNVIATKFGIVAMTFKILTESAYCLAVLIFSIRKRRYAYTHQTYSIAILSVITLLSPIFVLSFVFLPWATSWATSATVVMNTAATVVVWDWIDSIEAQEKKEQKSGVMGRQIYEPEVAAQFNRNLQGTGGGQGAWVGTSTRKHRMLPFDRPYVAWQRAIKDYIVRSGSAISAFTSFGGSQPSTGTTGADIGASQPTDVAAHPIAFSRTLTDSVAGHPANLGMGQLNRFNHPVKHITRKEPEEQIENASSDAPQHRLASTSLDESPLAGYQSNGTQLGEFNQTPGAGPVHLNSHQYDIDTRSIASATEPPQVFNRHPGFEPGDYWDEKSRR
jgi:hypothetical protein